jgi:hypothetical protein
VATSTGPWGSVKAGRDASNFHGGVCYGFEIKRTIKPSLPSSMRTAFADLGLARLDVLHAGAETFPLAASIWAVAARRLLDDVPPLGA